MTYRRNGMGQFLKRSKLLIENARGVPEIAQVLTGYGYTAEKLGLGAALLAEVEALASKREMDTGESRQATGALNSAWQEADDAYLKALNVARAAFGQDPKASAALKLYGARKQSIAGWLDQARTFFANLQGDAQLCEGMKVYGYTPEKIAAGAALVEGVRMKLQSHTEESGAAQLSTVGRDKKIAELDQWVSDLRAICKVALADNPQQLEQLGILVLNAPRTKKLAPAQSTAASSAP